MGSSKTPSFLIFSKGGGCESSAKVCVPPFYQFSLFFLVWTGGGCESISPDLSEPRVHSNLVESVIRNSAYVFLGRLIHERLRTRSLARLPPPHQPPGPDLCRLGLASCLVQLLLAPCAGDGEPTVQATHCAYGRKGRSPDPPRLQRQKWAAWTSLYSRMPDSRPRPRPA